MTGLVAPWLELTILLVTLLLLRQNILVLVGTAVVYSYVVWGGYMPRDWQFGDWQAIDPLAWQSAMLDVWDATNREILLSIPLYILAGSIMARGSIAERLIAIMRQVMKPVPGGLALATILSCAVFSAISGSSTVTLLAVGAIMYPALLQEGYSKTFSLGAICAGGTLGIIIPPSIPLILYGFITQTSIADLFVAGIGPAIVLISLFAIYALLLNWSKRSGMWDLSAYRAAFAAIGGRQPQSLSAAVPENSPTGNGWAMLGGAVWESLAVWRRGVFSLLLPIIILGGIYSGHFTPTESAAVAVLAALLIEVFIHRELSFKDIIDVTTDTTRLLGSLFPILALAFSLNTFLVLQQIPQDLVATLTEVFDDKASFIFASNILLLVVGFVIDIGSAVLILGPLLAPVAENFALQSGNIMGWVPGDDVTKSLGELARTHFGIMMIVNLEIGYLTPPMGLNIIVAMGAFRESFGTVCKAVIPFIFLMLVALALTIFFPWLVMVTVA